MTKIKGENNKEIGMLVSPHERHFYKSSPTFGRFGMRIFNPQIMPDAHAHGHVELNYLIGASMDYEIDGKIITIPPNRIACFWAAVPHRLSSIKRIQNAPKLKLGNIYYPLDAFLTMPHIAEIQIAVLAGGLVILPEEAISFQKIRTWYKDYRSKKPENLDVLKMEINVMLRRAQLGDLEFIVPPHTSSNRNHAFNNTHIHHVVAMMRFILENLSTPMTNADVAAVTGLHQNYALNLFSEMMHIPMKRFIIRMRLLKARAMLMESNMAISSVAEDAGFTSISQFYHHFVLAYNLTPKMIRKKYRN